MIVLSIIIKIKKRKSGSQIEAAMSVYRAENAKSAITAANSGSGTNSFEETIKTLGSLIKSIPVAPQGTYDIDSEGYLTASGTEVSEEVCLALGNMSGGVFGEFDVSVSLVLGDSKFGCIPSDGNEAPFTLAYKLE